MPLLDHCHAQIVRALQKAGWTVNDKPKYIYDLETGSFIFIDVDASREANGFHSAKQQLYAEIKCFPGHNPTQELYIALGQYLIYRTFLAVSSDTASLYLAIPSTIYEKVFNAIVMQTCRDNRVKLPVMDLETETIQQWVEWKM